MAAACRPPHWRGDPCRKRRPAPMLPPGQSAPIPALRSSSHLEMAVGPGWPHRCVNAWARAATQGLELTWKCEVARRRSAPRREPPQIGDEKGRCAHVHGVEVQRISRRRRKAMTAKAVFDAAVGAWNASDEARFVEQFAPDTELISPGGLNFSGIDGAHRWYRLWQEACPDRTVRYTNVVSEGDRLLGEGIFEGTHTGVLHLPTGDVPATGRHLT